MCLRNSDSQKSTFTSLTRIHASEIVNNASSKKSAVLSRAMLNVDVITVCDTPRSTGCYGGELHDLVATAK